MIVVSLLGAGAGWVLHCAIPDLADWLRRRRAPVPRRGLAPQAWVRDRTGQPIAFDQRDPGDENDAQRDIATEGLGVARPVPVWLWGRGMDGRWFVRRAYPSWTTPLLELPPGEYQLWDEIIRRQVAS